ncbi:hypothetical protein AB0D04_00705 [Streptomyces sp. NPDC048483]|uniref:hypothetical protein n=1 Tax=Streptomyces sp. NPDC048483 TaxID=3154927 RepID=UPI0034416620
MSRSRLVVVGGVVLAAGLVVSGCSSGDQGGGSDGGKGGAGAEKPGPQAKMLGQVPMAKVSELTGSKGMWATKKNFVKADLKKIVGYPLDGGKAQWTVPLGGEICWSSPRPTPDGLIGVVFKNDKDDPAVCTEIGLVDLNSGKMRWHKQALDGTSSQMFDEVTIGGGTVAAAGTNVSAAWTVGGKPLWKPSDKKCQDTGYAGGGDKLIAVRDCGETKHPKVDIQTIDPRTRAVKSSYKLPAGTETAHVVSVDPLVVAVDDGKAQGGSSVSEFVSIDDSAAQGKLLAKISAKGGKYGKYEAECPANEADRCSQLAVSKKAGALYLGTRDPLDASSDAENDIVAFSLKTGKQTGKIEGAEDGRLLPIGVDEDGQVIAYQEADDVSEKAGAVWRIDPASNKKTQVQQNPAAGLAAEAQFDSDRELLYANDRLYLGSDYVRAPASYDKGKQVLAVVFGAKK